MTQHLHPLPIDVRLSEIVRAVLEHGALVLIGPPGSGKTTRVPPALLEALPGSGSILVLQPRRIAARAVAARIAAERGWQVGGRVGYQVRFESRAGPDTRLLVVTEGILTRRLQGDPALGGVAVVVLDEFHERSVHLDFALAALREVRSSLRPDLRVVVMSATLDPAPVARFLGGCPVVEVAGRPYSLEVRHLDRPSTEPTARLAAHALRETWPEARGHALVFLPGIREIRACARELEGFAGSRGVLLTPLHGGLSLEEQALALEPSARRKVVLSTNIAETSLTIEGVDLVVDSGLARLLRHDPRHGTDRLETARISRRSAEQRAGRAGRLGPGLVVRLWTRAEHEALEEEELPEVRRVDLASVVLELRAWGVSDPARFGWFEAPDPGALRRAEELLTALGAIERPGGPLTATGREILGLPAHPRLARLVAAAHHAGLLRQGAALAALLEERDLLSLSLEPRRPGTAAAGSSDLLLRLDLLEEAEAAGFRGAVLKPRGVDPAAARAAARARDLLIRCAREALGPKRGRRGGPDAASRAASREWEEEALLRILLLAYPDRVARRRAAGSPKGRMVGGRGVVLAPSSVVQDHPFFIALEVEEGDRTGRAEALVRLASGLRREWIEEAFPDSIGESVETAFDPDKEKVRSFAVATYRDLPLEEPRERPPDPAAAAAALLAAARERAEELFLGDDEARGLILRVRFLREWMPELGLPLFEPAELEEALEGAARGAASLAEVRGRGLAAALRARLSSRQLAALEREAPESVALPGGRRASLVYEPGKPPVLRARVQELLGMRRTPAVAAGKVPLLLHLLGPNFRPVQITRDLESFWINTYPQVRKDLRARYPRHSWPEDPLDPSVEPGGRRPRGRS